MIIKLLSREIEIVKVKDTPLKGDSDGKSMVYDNKIYIEENIPFFILLHEINHFWFYLTGQSAVDSFATEVVCDSFGQLIEQLMLENGVDIFDKLKKFAT